MNRSRFIFAMALISFLVIGAVPIVDAGGSVSETRSEEAGYFGSERIYESTSRSLSGGMDIGDVDGDGEMEVAVCDFKGVLFLLDPDGEGGFSSRTIWEESGAIQERTLFEVKIWDLIPERDGLEMVVGGYSRNITMIYYEEGEWVSDVIYRSPHRIINMALADVDDAPGMEILFASDKDPEDWNLRYIARDGADWVMTEIITDGAVRSITHSDADSTLAGAEIYITTKNWLESGDGRTESSVVQIHHDGSTWARKKIYTNSEDLIANVRVGDIWSMHDGNEIIAVDFNGNCTMIWEEAGAWESRLIFQTHDVTTGGSYPLEGMVVGEFNPMNDGEECMISGYYNKVNQVLDVDGEVISDLAWSTEFSDVRLEIAGVETGDLILERPGNEVIIASFQGWVEMLYFEYDDVELNVEFGEVQIVSGGTEYASFEVIPKGFVSGPVLVELDDVEGLTFQVSPDLTITGHEPVEVDITMISIGQVTQRVFRTVGINVTVAGIRVREEFDLVMIPDVEEVSLQLTYTSGFAYKEIPTVLASKISLVGGEYLDMIDLEVKDVPVGVDANCDTPMLPSGSANLLITVSSNAEVGRYNLQIDAKYGGNVLSSIFYSLEIGSIEGNIVADMIEDPDEENMYIVRMNFTSPHMVPDVDVKLFLLGSIRYSSSHDLEQGMPIKIRFSIEKDVVDEEVGLEVSKLGTTLYKGSVGEVSFVEKEEEGSPLMILALIVVIVIALALVLFVFYRYRSGGESTGEESLMGVGGARRYNLRQEGPRGDVRPGGISGRRGGPRGSESGRRAGRSSIADRPPARYDRRGDRDGSRIADRPPVRYDRRGDRGGSRIADGPPARYERSGGPDRKRSPPFR